MITLRRLDHIVLQVPDIEAAHARLLAMGFAEAWPVGRTWSVGPTSGVALGGMNLELSQPNEDAPDAPGLAELVFEPLPGADLSRVGRVSEKIEGDPERLAARGFPPEITGEPQRICTNAFPAGAAWPWFVCDYAPLLRERLGPGAFAAPFGSVVRVEVGPLRVRPRFAPVAGEPDLAAFLGAVEVERGPIVVRGTWDAVAFASGTRLELANLTLAG